MRTHVSCGLRWPPLSACGPQVLGSASWPRVSVSGAALWGTAQGSWVWALRPFAAPFPRSQQLLGKPGEPSQCDHGRHSRISLSRGPGTVSNAEEHCVFTVLVLPRNQSYHLGRTPGSEPPVVGSSSVCLPHFVRGGVPTTAFSLHGPRLLPHCSCALSSCSQNRPPRGQRASKSLLKPLGAGGPAGRQESTVLPAGWANSVGL